MQSFQEILELVFNLWVAPKPTLVAMDSNVVKYAKHRQNKAE
jgi:hypothetical protein